MPAVSAPPASRRGAQSKPEPGKQRRPDTTGRAAAPERILRLFFAVALPPELRAELAAAQAKLSQNWRRVETSQLHLTLAYLPGVPQGRVTELRALGKRLALHTPPLALRLRGTGYHPNVGSPRVWFVKVEGEGLGELAAALQSELTAAGFECEGQFQPHVTLARKKGPAPRVPPLTFAQGWSAQQFSLIHTFLPRDKTGPVYDLVSSFELNFGVAPPSEPQTAPEPTQATQQATVTQQARQSPEERHG